METLRHKSIRLIVQCHTINQKGIQNTNPHVLASNVVSFPSPTEEKKISFTNNSKIVSSLHNTCTTQPNPLVDFIHPGNNCPRKRQDKASSESQNITRKRKHRMKTVTLTGFNLKLCNI